MSGDFFSLYQVLKRTIRSAALPCLKHGCRHSPAPMRSPCMYTCNCYFFFLGHISSCSHLRPKRRVGWAQFDRRSHVAGGLGAIRAVCRAWQTFKSFLALSTLEANPRVSATSPGIGFLNPLSPCTHVIFGCKPGFSARRGYMHISLFLPRAPRYDPTAQQQSTVP